MQFGSDGFLTKTFYYLMLGLESVIKASDSFLPQEGRAHHPYYLYHDHHYHNLSSRLESIIEAGDSSVPQNWRAHPVFEHQTHWEH